MNRKTLHTYGTLLVYGLALVLCAFAITGCGTAQAHRMVDDWTDARSDGQIDEPEMRMLDRDAEDLDASIRAPTFPPTGIPWLDLGVSLATAGLAGIGAHKYTMKKRDQTRAEALAEVTKTA